MLEGYSVGAREVVSVAVDEAGQLGHSRVGTEHLLLGLLSDEDSDAAAALRAAGATLSAARFTVSEVATEAVEPSLGEQLPFTPRAQRALERARRFARRDREPDVTPEHVLLGVLDVEGLGCQVLRGLGVDIVRLRKAVVPAEAELVTADIDIATSDQDEPEEPVTAVRPRCPHCAADLDVDLAVTRVTAKSDDESPTDVSVVFCSACGAALGMLPRNRRS